MTSPGVFNENIQDSNFFTLNYQCIKKIYLFRVFFLIIIFLIKRDFFFLERGDGPLIWVRCLGGNYYFWIFRPNFNLGRVKYNFF